MYISFSELISSFQASLVFFQHPANQSSHVPIPFLVGNNDQAATIRISGKIQSAEDSHF